MRILLAWPLLLLVCAQWISGSLCLRVVYAIEVESQMTDTEAKLATTIKEETGLETQVQILEEEQLNMDQVGYSNFFMFSKEMDGDTVYFKLNTDSVKLVEYEVNKHEQRNAGEDSDNGILFKRLFPQFTITETPQLFGDQISNHFHQNFSNKRLTDLFNRSILTPPPQLG